MTDDELVLPAALANSLLSYVRARYPVKSFGYLLAASGRRRPTEFIGFENNIRNDDRWRERFEARGRYFTDHPDAGFVADEDESWRVQQYIMRRNLHEVAVFHTHRRHPGNFSGIDYDLHVSRSVSPLHLIISLRNVELPQLRAFATSDGGVREVRLSIPGLDHHLPSGPAAAGTLDDWRAALSLDRSGLPRCRDARVILAAITGAGRYPEFFHDYVTTGLLRDAEDRYERFVAADMVAIPETAFTMGTAADEIEHFCGETPQHRVVLTPFRMSRYLLTNKLYSLLDPERTAAAASQDMPVVGISWFEAALCAAWFGCRLPTEAEWEFACGAGGSGQWCCAAEQLPRYAWYAENAERRLHPVGARDPNPLGLFDLHGNAWEWCHDTYFFDYYGSAPRRDPVAGDGDGTALTDEPHKVARGGGFLALAEMCRTRFRLHDPAGYSAADLGFRLARRGGDERR
ncbi:formylglycine-generating enzyme family protein [Nocardia blacklockiae]|uniref:formylglycine-generating enzyme family protein n=1 Tax=Nocardia blacklockiae TaxID=480036 RepID=UPI00189348C6|nr:formylglycine-generating enzyme family protein [Nocardia blacklockiae]MBF6170089.1 SUMF1/EgtB/PvdO family nonheme iron enzyme [Nocardia blacklockiae]